MYSWRSIRWSALYGSTTFEGVGFKNSSNLFDVGIVITFVVDAWVLTPLGSSTDLNLLKFLRLIRLVRVIRLIRLLRIFKDLTALVRAPTTSITAISWMCALLLLFTLLFALLLNGVLDILVLDPHTEHYHKYFSKNLKASFTLFQILTGFSSNAHNNVLGPLMTNTAFPWLPYLLFQVYVWVFRYGLITSAVGVFVSNVIAKKEKSSQKKADSLVTTNSAIIREIVKIFQHPEIDSEMVDLASTILLCFQTETAGAQPCVGKCEAGILVIFDPIEATEAACAQFLALTRNPITRHRMSGKITRD